MGLALSKESVDDKDANCRLRHGLNAHCLAHIFQYLGVTDLYTLGNINEYYSQIIDDLVIPHNRIDFEVFCFQKMSIQKFFKRHEKQIRKIRVFNQNSETFRKFCQSITKYCAVDQLKDVSIVLNHELISDIKLPLHFRLVINFHIRGGFTGTRLYAPFAESLQQLNLEAIKLHPEFDWTKLTNLRILRLHYVRGFRYENFIKFLSQRPKLENFYQMGTVEAVMHSIGEAMAKHCSDKIRFLQDLHRYHRMRPSNFYDFLTEFKNLEELRLTTKQICAGELIYPIKYLAGTALKTLHITCYVNAKYSHYNCDLENETVYNELKMENFSSLKTIQINMLNNNKQRKNCEIMKLFTMYSSIILSNVEKIVILSEGGEAYHCKFIEFIPKLRQLVIDGGENEPTSKQVIRLGSLLKRILQKRSNEKSSTDFIEMKIPAKHLIFFQRMIGFEKCIKLTEIKYFGDF